MRPSLSLAAGALLAVALSGCSSTGSPVAVHNSPSPSKGAVVVTASQLVSSAITTAQSKGSVHYVLTTPLGAGVVGTTRGDVSHGDGRQLISAPGGGAVVTLLVGETAYSLGNTKGLEGVGMPAATARKLNGRWLFVRSTSPVFKAVVDQVTLSSVLSYITPTGLLAEHGPVRLFGQQVLEITGGIPSALQGGAAKGTSILYVSAGAGHLPVAFDYRSAKSHELERWIFTKWGETVHVVAPAGAHAAPA